MRYRIKVNGNGMYFVQFRRYFIWWTIKGRSTSRIRNVKYFKTLEEAEEEIRADIKYRVYRKMQKLSITVKVINTERNENTRAKDIT